MELPNTEISKRYQFLLRFIKPIGDALLKKAQTPFNVYHKATDDYVTSFDLEVNNKYIKLIKQNFPENVIYSEEGDYKNIGKEFTWIIDPIDGTNMFIHKLPIWTTTIAILYKQLVVASAVYYPFTKELFHVQKGAGAFLNNQQIHVGTCKDLKKAFFISTCSIRKKFPGYFPVFTKITKIAERIRIIGVSSLELCYVACGRVDLNLAYGLDIYDAIPGLLMVQEAGGKVKDWLGNEIKTISNKKLNLVAGNETIVNQTLPLLN